jgi:hypothetical protein
MSIPSFALGADRVGAVVVGRGAGVGCVIVTVCPVVVVVGDLNGDGDRVRTGCVGVDPVAGFCVGAVVVGRGAGVGCVIVTVCPIVVVAGDLNGDGGGVRRGCVGVDPIDPST